MAEKEKNRGGFSCSLDRRQFIKQIGATGAFLAAGDLMSRGSTSSAWAAQPKQGGTFIFAMTSTPPQFDPAYFKDTEEYHVGAMCCNRLVHVTPDMKLAPELALSWESNQKANVWTFNLRKGVRFHNGRELEAKDVANCINHYLDAKGPAASELAPAEKFEAVGKYVVKGYLKSGFADFPYLLGRPQAFILPHDVPIEKWKTSIVGTGPFKFKEFVPGEFFRAERNPDYWDKDHVYFKEVKMVIIPDQDTKANALISGEIDLMPDCDPERFLFLKGKKGIVTHQVSSLGWQPLEIITTEKPFNDVRVRRAMKACVNREQFVSSVLQGMGKPANDNPIPSFDKNFFDISVKKQDYELAKKLLAEAGYPNGLDVTIHTSEIRAGMVPSALTFKDQFAPAGIRVEIKVHPADGFWKQVWRKVPLCIISWNGRTTTYGGLYAWFHSKGSYNTSQYFSPLIDACLDEAVGETNSVRAAKRYSAAQALISEDGGVIIPYLKDLLVAYRDNVHDLPLDPTRLLAFVGAWKS